MTAYAPRAEPHPLSRTGTVLLAIASGLSGGYLDLVVMIFRKYCWNDLKYFWSGSDFPGSVPVAHAVLLAVTGLDRGFAHYEDYPLTPRYLPGRTVAGSWILKSILGRGDFYNRKWIDLQSRDTRGINDAFLDWLRRRRSDRPFFAFLNYFDA